MANLTSGTEGALKALRRGAELRKTLEAVYGLERAEALTRAQLARHSLRERSIFAAEAAGVLERLPDLSYRLAR